MSFIFSHYLHFLCPKQKPCIFKAFSSKKCLIFVNFHLHFYTTLVKYLFLLLSLFANISNSEWLIFVNYKPPLYVKIKKQNSRKFSCRHNSTHLNLIHFLQFGKVYALQKTKNTQPTNSCIWKCPLWIVCFLRKPSFASLGHFCYSRFFRYRSNQAFYMVLL